MTATAQMIYEVPWDAVTKEPDNMYIKIDGSERSCSPHAAAARFASASLREEYHSAEGAPASDGAIAGCHLSAVRLVSRFAEPAPEVG